MTAPARRRGGQLTVQGWLNVVLAVMGILVLAGAIAGAILMNRTDAVPAPYLLSPSIPASMRAKSPGTE